MTGAPQFAEPLPYQVAGLQARPGTPPGPGGSGGVSSTSPGAGWEVLVRSYADYATLLCQIPQNVLLSWQFAKQLGDLGSGTVVLDMDDNFWSPQWSFSVSGAPSADNYFIATVIHAASVKVGDVFTSSITTGSFTVTALSAPAAGFVNVSFTPTAGTTLESCTVTGGRPGSLRLPGGLPVTDILDFECLWQFSQDGVVRFEFLGETITEQLIDTSEQRQVTVTGPGTISTLKWAMCAPLGFPDIILKLDGIEDSFDEVNSSGQGVLDTNIWNSVSPSSDVYITPVQGLFNYPGGAGYAVSTLYPSGSVTLNASPGTTFLGATPYDACDTLISAQVTPIGLNTSTGGYSVSGLDGSELTQFYVQSNKNDDYYAMIGLSSTSFYCQLAGPSGTFTKTIGAYNPTNHAYWMITEQGGSGGGSGTFYFWTSPDGQNWTQAWQVVHNWDATSCSFYFTATYDTANSQSAQLTNLNSNVTTPSYQGDIYLGYPIMGIWFDQWAKAQARGTIPFTTTSMSALGDSAGNPWTDSQNVQTVNGTDLYSFLQSCASVLNADYVMQPGFVLQVGQPEQNTIGVGVDRHTTIVFHEGGDVVSKGRTRQRNQIQNLIGAENQDGHEISASDGTSISDWGQREAWFQTGAQVDPVSMEIAAAATAASNADEIESQTLTILPWEAGRTVFQNFDVGDWVGLEDPNFSVESVRVTVIAVQSDNDGNETHELTVLTYVQWLEQQLTFISNKLGGSFVNAPGLTPVAPSKYGTGQVPTYFSPAAAIANLADVVHNPASGGAAPVNSPLVYNPATGQYQQAGTTDPVSGNTIPLTVSGANGSTTVGPGTHTVTSAGPAAAPDGGGAQPAPSSVSTSPTQVVTVVDGVTRVTVGVQGDGTVTTVETNAPAPGTPDTPTVTGVPVGLVVAWDGLLAGASPLSDFLQVQVHCSVTSGFTPSTATLQGTLTTAGLCNISSLTPGTTYYVKLVAVNRSQVSGTPTAQVSAQAGFVLPSQISQLTASLLGNLGVLNPNPYFWGGDGSGWSGFNGTFAVTSTPAAGAPYKYAGVFTSNGSPSGAMEETSGKFPAMATTPGTQYMLTAWVNCSESSVSIGFDWDLNGTYVTTTTTNVTVPVNTWTQVVAIATAPSSGINQGVCRIGPNPASSGATVQAQAILALPQVPGSLIQAGTITAAQIAAGTIFAGIVNGTLISGATIEGGLIFGGLISGAAIEGGIISGTTIEGGLISGSVFEGLDWLLNSMGLFFYAGNPSAGNLVASFANMPGTDQFGNAFPGGFSMGLPGTGQIQIQPNINQAFDIGNVIFGAFAAMAQYWTGDVNQMMPSMLGSLLLGSGSTTKMASIMHSPFNGEGAVMLLEAQNDGGTDTPVITMGTVTMPDGMTMVFVPIMTLTPYAMVLYSNGSGGQVVVSKTSGSGTIPIPAGVTVVKGEVWGGSGGSGGGSGTGTPVGGGGGGGSEYACETTLAVTSGGTVSYSVGAAGTAGTAGGAGGTGGNTTLTGTSVTVTAHGGHGGSSGGSSNAGGAGGSGSTNSVHFSGGAGGTGINTGTQYANANFGNGGGGGSSGGTSAAGHAGQIGQDPPAGGGNGGAAPPGGAAGGAGATSQSLGLAGSAPGGGPGGSGSSVIAGNQIGVAGSTGQVRVTYTTGVPQVGYSVNFGSAFNDQFGNSIPAGMNVAVPIKASGGTVTTPTLITTDSWHSATPNTNWSGSGNGVSGFFYRLLPDGDVEIAFDLLYSGVAYTAAGSGSGIAIAAGGLPTAYRPATLINLPLAGVYGLATSGATVYPTIGTDGSVTMEANSGTAFKGNCAGTYRYPLGSV